MIVKNPEKPFMAEPTNNTNTGQSKYIISRMVMASSALPRGGANRAGRLPPVSVQGPKRRTIRMDGRDWKRIFPMSILAARVCT